MILLLRLQSPLPLLLLVIPAKAGRFWAAEWRHHPWTFHALAVARQSKEESPAKLPIACGARVTFLCSHKEK
ncbi:hypothetical protein GOY17_13385 [Lysobacter soli]|uniref:hypothetical protein n=1 Tax=Lysobacter soli TaxID=453783 RepID=UPI0012EDEEAD|nr:hypothetical protein [Lysobacter soli]QGW65813.1 hypothetical protein GOY17_13385 [Lysobacter soli]